MKFKTNDGLDLYFDIGGKGIPCIFLHGGPGYWSKSFHHYSKVLLEKKLNMIYLDQRGCGRSGHSLRKDYSLNKLVNDIEELRVFLGINEWIVMAHSFGGILAVNYANQYPEQTKGLILSNVTLNIYDSFAHQMKKGSEILRTEIKELSAKSISTFIEDYFSVVGKLMEINQYFNFQYVDVANKRAIDIIDEIGLNSDPDFQGFIFSSEEFFQDFTTLTNQISSPTLVIAGAYDDAVGPSHHKLFGFKNSTEVMLASAHHPYIENQSEYKNTIMNFIDSKFSK
ncbi:alpha/beta fold hydrolase [Virgibacillus halodenitrificans]|uniref:alpha/beta fold hydrolase n=1 Tax=Virgibacillus halodenitrificans TaxID=1482 RepID=UPI002DBF0343|nr:alpha/beta hydrolase [Virgibacillus halodenitrificans]MEC2158841.1 alpha/beta hydrolase [Virgibacillus halodenitrificans]